MAHYLLNFVFVFGSMVLFFVPFVVVFWWRQREHIHKSRPHFNYFMERFFASKESNYLVMTWAAAEAVCWFIIPEFLLILMIFMRVKGKIKLVKYDIAGTIVGTLIALAWHVPQKQLLEFPYIYQGMLDQVHVWYVHHGVWGLLYQPFSGVPYKVFTHSAVDFQFFVPLFIVIAVAARMARYVVVYELTKALYPVVHPFVRRHYGVLFVLVIAVFTAMLLHVSHIYGPGYVAR